MTLEEVDVIYLNHSLTNLKDIKRKVAKIMGQFLDYLASVFTLKKTVSDSTASKDGSGHHYAKGSNSGNHVTFADNSFTQLFQRNNAANTSKLSSIKQTNKRTILFYQFLSTLHV